MLNILNRGSRTSRENPTSKHVEKKNMDQVQNKNQQKLQIIKLKNHNQKKTTKSEALPISRPAAPLLLPSLRPPPQSPPRSWGPCGPSCHCCSSRLCAARTQADSDGSEKYLILHGKFKDLKVMVPRIWNGWLILMERSQWPPRCPCK